MFMKVVCAVSVLVVLQGATNIAGRRCSQMLKDKPCTTEGSLPLTLRCDRKTGEFFSIQSLSVEYHPGVWTKVPAAKAIVSDECRRSRSQDASLEYYCEITDRGLCPFADKMRNVNVTYYCWEIDPELLQGFVQQGEKNPWLDQNGSFE